MADESSSLDILINTLANTKGTEQVAAALAGLKKQVEDQRDQIGQLEKANEKLNSGLKEGAGHVEHLHINHRALHRIMHMIGHETAPELGLALTGAMMGSLGAVIALGAAFEFISKVTEKAAEATKKLAEEQASLNTDVWKSMLDGAKQAEDHRAENLKAMKAQTTAMAKHALLLEEQIKNLEEVAKVSGDKTQVSVLGRILDFVEDQKATNEALSKRIDGIH